MGIADLKFTNPDRSFYMVNSKIIIDIETKEHNLADKTCLYLQNVILLYNIKRNIEKNRKCNFQKPSPKIFAFINIHFQVSYNLS